MTPIVFDMETRDPDDIPTLCLIATHPRARLTAVTVNPGTPAQIGVVRAVLSRLGLSAVPVGARVPSSDASAVSSFHYDWLGPVGPAAADGVAHEVLAAALPESVLLTGAPLHNLRLLINNHPDLWVRKWVAQGGFAGAPLVPAGDQLPKFAGLETCLSFNFGNDSKGALLALSSPRIGERWLVSKNVTHGVAWDAAMQARLSGSSLSGSPLSGSSLSEGARLAVSAMAVYLRANPAGKLLHDPLAFAALLDPEAFRWAEVSVYRTGGEWGARPASGTGTFITVGVDAERALSVLVG